MHPFMYRETPEERRAAREAEYEEKLVAKLISRYGLSRFKSRLRTTAQKALGTSLLKFSIFSDMFESFPVRLAVARLPNNFKDFNLSLLFSKISTRKIIEHYFALRDELQDDGTDKPLALVMPWPKVPKGLVIHTRELITDELPSDVDKPCVRLVWTLNKRRRKYGARLIVEPFDQFLSGLNWCYED
jgi:hypothetical protein